jgi:hypothetical protein
MRPRTPRIKGRVSRTYEWVLGLPGLVLVTVLWLAGAVLIGLCALALYSFWSLLRVATGALVS